MDPETAAFRDDVLPTARKIDVPPEKWINDRVSLDNECLHLHIGEPRRDLRFWIQHFPRLTSLKYLELKSRPNQELFEAICATPNLERLDIFWSNIVDLRPITALRKLTHFCLGSSPKVKSLEPLTGMRSLVALGIRGVKLCRDVSPVGELTGLRGLRLWGSGWVSLTNTQLFESLSPLSRLTNLKFFSMLGVKTNDRSLAALCEFRKLKHLELGTLHHWPASEYAKLHAALPHLDCEELRRAAIDPSFQKENRIR